MTREEAKKVFEYLEKKSEHERPCDDVVSRQAVIYYIKGHIHEIITESGTDKNAHTNSILRALINGVETMPSVTQKSGKCKNCKYFEYDSVAKVDGIPLIVAHEICNKWGDGCKTKEDGYCFLYEPQEGSDKE